MPRSFPAVRALLGVAVACSGLSHPTPVLAGEQDDRIQALEKRLESSAKIIEQLAARVAELERGAAPGARPASGPESGAARAADDAAQQKAQAQAIAKLQEDVSQMSDGLSQRGFDLGLPVHGFADVTAGWSSKQDPLKLRGFGAGTLDLYLTPQFGDRVRSLVELAVEYDSDGQSSVDMERLQLGYTFNDSLTAWIGRFHTPFGLWNTSFHHGANLQTSISRPRFIDFEDQGGIIPAHSVGLWGSGRATLGNGKITYDAYISNGPSIRERELDFNPYTDDNNNKMLGGNLGYQLGGDLHGLTIGMHGFASKVTAYSTAAAVLSRTQLRMWGGYVGYDANDWEIFGEYYHFSNADSRGGPRLASNAWFAHFGRTFGSITPYARIERASLNPADNYFISQQVGRSYTRAVLGARYALDPRSSFKLEWSTTNEPALMQLDGNGLPIPFTGANYRRAGFQYSIAF